MIPTIVNVNLEDGVVTLKVVPPDPGDYQPEWEVEGVGNDWPTEWGDELPAEVVQAAIEAAIEENEYDPRENDRKKET